jgi:hypothetical protein
MLTIWDIQLINREMMDNGKKDSKPTFILG